MRSNRRKFSLHPLLRAFLDRLTIANSAKLRRVATTNLPSRYGFLKVHAYRSANLKNEHLALILGEPAQDQVLCRVHSSCATGDLLGSLRCDCGDQLHAALTGIQNEGAGVLLYLDQEGRGIGLSNKMRAYQLQDQGLDTVEANLALGFDADSRDYRNAAEILTDLGIRSVRLMTNNPRKSSGLERYGIPVVESVPLVTTSNRFNIRYLETKKAKLSHNL